MQSAPAQPDTIHRSRPDYRAKSPYLTADGGFELAWIRERAETRARNIAAKGYRRETEAELFREFLSEEMQIALQIRDNRFPPVHIHAPRESVEEYRQLAISEAIQCGKVFHQDFRTRNFIEAERCFLFAELYTQRAADLDWANAAPAYAMAAE